RVEVDVETDLRCRGGDLLEHLPDLLFRHTLHRDQRFDLGGARAGRSVGCQLVGTPGHVDTITVFVAVERGSEASLADVAPRAGDVGPHLDVDGGEVLVRRAHAPNNLPRRRDVPGR